MSDIAVPPPPKESPPPGHPMSKRLKVLLSFILFILLGLLGVTIFKTFSPSPAVPSASLPSPSASFSQASSSASLAGIPDNPASYIHTLSLTPQIDSTASGKIKGTIKIQNTTNKPLTDLYPAAVLFTPETNTPTIQDGKKIIVQERNIESVLQLSPITIGANQTSIVPFELSYTPHGPVGNYQLETAVTDKLGNYYGLGFIYTPLKASQDMAVLGSCNVTVDGTDYGVNEGPPVVPGGLAQGKCTISNPTPNTLTLTPHIDYAALHYFYYPQSEKLHSSAPETITLKGGETKTISFTLPTNLPPQVYESYVTFLDPLGNPQSFIQVFRWTISGASARIEQVSLDKDFYQKGSISKVTVLADPSMDLYWSNNPNYKGKNTVGTVLQNSKLSVTLSDGTGKSCGSVTNTLPVLTPPATNNPPSVPGWKPQVVSVPVQTDCVNPKADVKLMDGTTVLAETTRSLLTPQINTLPKNPRTSIVQPFSLAAIVILSLLIVFTSALLLKKDKIKTPPPQVIAIFLLALSAIFFYGHINPVSADLAIRGTAYPIPANPPDFRWGQSLPDTGLIDVVEGDKFNATSLGATASWASNYGTITIAGVYTWGLHIGGCGNSYAYGDTSEVFATADGGNSWIQTGQTSTGYSNQGRADPSNFPWTITATTTSSPVTYGVVLGYNLQFGLGDGAAVYTSDNGNNQRNLNLYNTNCCSGSYSGPGPIYGSVTFGAPSCTSPDPSSVCSGTSYSDFWGNSCSGTKPPACVNGNPVCGGTCDTTPPSVSIVNPPANTCYKGATGTNGTPWSNTEPLQIRVDDTRNGTVPSSGVSSVSIKITNLSTGTITRTVNASLLSGSATNGTYQVTIPADSISFPTNGVQYSITGYATDNTSHISNTPSYSFTYDATGNACVAPHIQTQNGDVHSQQNVGQ